jgi:hypothetical protein
MSEFCVKCSEREAEIELLRKEIYECKQHADRLQSEVDALSLDVAFYGGNMINLSCNNK